MTMEHDTMPVTVIGLGAMGSALARAYLAAGYKTAVWNRNAARSAPLAAAGAMAFGDIGDAVRASSLLIACLTSYDATIEALTPVASELAGRTLVTLNTGTPSGARNMAAWAAGHGADFLDGAVKNTPDAVGKPDTQLYYCGQRAVFDRYSSALAVLGGDTQYLGADVDLAALYELAVGGTLLPALLGFFQGAALVTSRGIAAASIVPHTQKWLQMIAAELPRLAQEIDSGNYDQPSAALGLFHAGIEHDHEIGREAGLDVRWHEPMHDLLRQAVADGRKDQSISALTELLRRPR